ncbi:unnamed protein product, partial [marine sediment metagenome]
MADELILESGSASESSNSYCDLTLAEVYYEERLHKSTWTDASDDTKEVALIWATKLLDRQIDWYGARYSETQALRYPRTGVQDLDGY